MDATDTHGSEAPLTTADVARTLGVSTATVKRWAETGALPSSRTPGGHRRFRRREVEAMRDGLASSTSSLDRWVKKLLSDPDRALAAALGSERERLGAWYHVADSLGPVLEEIGREWEAGELCVADEATASSRLSRVLARCCEQLEPRPSAPRALLATPEGEDHTLGLSLVELCMRERGWRAIWAGRSTPASEMLASIARRAVDVVALSSSVASDPATLARVVDALVPACRESGIALLVGGRGPWPDPLAFGTREQTFTGLSQWMTELERASDPRAAAGFRTG